MEENSFNRSRQLRNCCPLIDPVNFYTFLFSIFASLVDLHFSQFHNRNKIISILFNDSFIRQFI